jgi:hypothetical protein
VRRLLSPSGVLLLRTGDRSLWMKHVNRGHWSTPEHVFHYNRRVLRKMLTEADMEIVWIKPAFDSDYPYLLFDYSRYGNTLSKRLARRFCSLAIGARSLLRLPKDDVFLLAKPRARK